MKKLFLPLLVIAGFCHAGEFPQIESSIQKLQPSAKITSIEESAVPGIYEVRMDSFEPVYMTKNGSNFFMGTLLSIDAEGKVSNRSDEKLRQERHDLLAKVSTNDMIVFRPKKTARIVYVFTDVDCGYCRKFHTDIADYNDAGIEVRYLAYPRGGADSEAAKKMESVWCNSNRQAALTKVKAGGDVKSEACKSPVGAEYRLGKSMAVQGTPAIFTEEGEQIGGYLSPEQMKKVLRIN